MYTSRTLTRAGLAGFALLLSAAASGNGSSAAGVTGTTTPVVSPHGQQRTAAVRDGVPRASHVFVIVGENTSLRQVTRRSAPYLAGVSGPARPGCTGYARFNTAARRATTSR